MHISNKYLQPIQTQFFQLWRLQYFHIFLAVFLLEEVINFKLGIALLVPIALLLMMVLNAQDLVSKSVPLGSYKAVVFAVFVIIYQIPSVLAAPSDCNLYGKFLSTTLMLGGVAWAVWWLKPEKAIFSESGSKLLLIWIGFSMILSWAGFDIMSLLGYKTTIHSGLYSEPSHLALHLIPLIAYRLLENFSDRLTWFILLLVFAIAPSSTLAIGFLGIFAIKFGMKMRSKWAIITLSMSAVIFFYVLAVSGFNNPLFSRVLGIINFKNNKNFNLSSAVWLNGWSQAFDNMMASHGWGVGINRMGCGALAKAGFLSSRIERAVAGGLILNSNDGSFMLAKIVAELGVFGLLIGLYISFLAINAIIRLSDNIKQNSMDVNVRHEMICRGAAGLTLVIYMYLRGTSYFAFPFLLAVGMLLRKPLCIHRSQNFD
jgi:hypothetical protein